MHYPNFFPTDGVTSLPESKDGMPLSSALIHVSDLVELGNAHYVLQLLTPDLETRLDKIDGLLQQNDISDSLRYILTSARSCILNVFEKRMEETE